VDGTSLICQYGHSDKVSVSNVVITTVLCTIPLRHEAGSKVSVDGQTVAV
jgi:hypothetical protein